MLQLEQPETDLTDTAPLLRRIVFKAAQPLMARYIRVTANRYLALTLGFPGGDRDTWLFADEILVR